MEGLFFCRGAPPEALSAPPGATSGALLGPAWATSGAHKRCPGIVSKRAPQDTFWKAYFLPRGPFPGSLGTTLGPSWDLSELQTVPEKSVLESLRNGPLRTLFEWLIFLPRCLFAGSLGITWGSLIGPSWDLLGHQRDPKKCFGLASTSSRGRRVTPTSTATVSASLTP